MFSIRVFMLVWMVLGCSLVATSDLAVAEEPGSADEKLRALFESEWEWTLETQPTFASELGDRRFNDQWPDIDLGALARRDAHRKVVLARLDAIDPADLSAACRVHYRLFRGEYEEAVEAYPFGWHLLPVTQRSGLQDAASLADSLRFETPDDYQQWIARIRAFPRYMEQTTALMRAGLDAGMIHPKIAMQRVPDQIKRQIVDDPSESLFFKPFRTMPESMAPRQRERLAAEARRAIAESVVPAYRRWLEFFEKDYLPASSDRIGAWQLPRGRELYAMRVRHFTSTNYTPEEVHRIGLDEVRRIRGEMDKVLERVEWKGTFREFLDHLRTDPKFYYDNPDDLLTGYRAICKRIDPEMVRLFRTMPRMPYGVEPIPMHLAPDTTTGYYRPPAADGSRAGSYFVNLYQPESRPRYEMEVLSTHEAVPGHHFQIALAMELDDLPLFRRYGGGCTAYIEGWALYSEKLGEDLGLYRDPYSKFGQLTYEMWRAVRLVVDTGMHHFQWTRQQSIDYFAANTPKPVLDIENEVDRYITWPGQALSYKIGELKIRKLRARAESELGERFDVRGFHDVVLLSGAVTLDVLESNVDAWIAARKDIP